MSLQKTTSKVDIGFIHASPLMYKKGKLYVPEQLEFLREKETIKQAIHESEKAIKFKSMVATQKNFSEMLSQEP